MQLKTVILVVLNILGLSYLSSAPASTILFKNSTDQNITNVRLPNQVQTGPILQGEMRQLPDDHAEKLRSLFGSIHVIANNKRYTCMGIDVIFLRRSMVVNVTHLISDPFVNTGIAYCEIIIKRNEPG
ncbi:MAG: hypothetical protein K0S11_227 [Gammaproteobacteria bacterium]|nr:hypothetical protein [Gammaproteobacteria bacterium]